jgi:DNA ligase D-like protein (predicted 3'-phosphoesterase)
MAVNSNKNKFRFVVQEHQSSHLHYDFRLEMPERDERDSYVLKSWAVPKNVPKEIGVKRLAIQVEDHNLGYIDFEGIIEEGNYGAGKVTIWDNGKYELLSKKYDEEGKLKEIAFILDGRKLKGEYALIKTRGFGSEKNKEKSWLIFKKKR